MRKVATQKFGESFYYVLDALIEATELDEYIEESAKAAEVEKLKKVRKMASLGTMSVYEALKIFGESNPMMKEF